MNAITMTAMANFRKNKSRNILIGIAIFLTAFLLTAVPTVGIGTASVEMAVTNKIYPTFYAMFRGVNEQQAKGIAKDERLKTVGLRADPGTLVCDNARIFMFSCDTQTQKMSKIKLKSGQMPEKPDEIVISEGILKAMGITAREGSQITLPYQVAEGDSLSLQKERTFTITGMAADSEQNLSENVYTAYVSNDFVKEEIPEDKREYSVYVQPVTANQVTVDEIEIVMNEIAESYGIMEEDIVFNKAYLYSNFIDPESYLVIAGIMAAILIAGIITIYSIYYVSMIDKVQEYGKLRAMGATRKQIRKLVFREGFTVAGIAAPIGVLTGALAGYGGLYYLMAVKGESLDSRGDVYVKAVKQVIQNHETSIIKLWVLVLALAAVFLAVYISLLKPMKAASRISPVEAIRYRGEEKRKKTKRKGYRELNVGKLTRSNLVRNKKRTFVTILTLACTGIFFIAIATLLNCMDPDTLARENVSGDFEISLSVSSGDKMHPELERYRIQQNNPLNQDLENTILAIDGVESLEKKYVLDATLKEVQQDGEDCETALAGVSKDKLEEIQKDIIDGQFTLEDLQQGDKIILTNGWIYLRGEPKLGAGDKVHLNVRDGEEAVTKEFTIAAVTDAPRSLYDSAGFVTSENVMNSMFHSDAVNTFEVMADSNEIQAVTEQLQQIVEADELLEMSTYQEELKSGRQVVWMTGGMCYALLIIFGLIGILNLVNTMINSVYARRRELGMLQAIGLSDRQMLKMLQMEGLYYTAGTVILSLAVGNLAGYAAFLYWTREGLAGIKTYHYPLVPTIILILVILTVQLLLTLLLTKDMKKQSLVDRIRFAD